MTRRIKMKEPVGLAPAGFLIGGGDGDKNGWEELGIAKVKWRFRLDG